MKKISMYMVTHKQVDYIPMDRLPIFVGSGNNDKGYLRDNTGLNISSKNPFYCELTAFYWIWKNDKSSDYISIEHYRRFFMNNLKPISKKKINQLLEKYDVIESRSFKFNMSILEYYSQNHYESDLMVIKKAIESFYPEYLDSFEKIMNGNKTSMCNMIIMSKENFNKYCEWLFTILEYVEKYIDITDRDKYQQRVFGFMSERLQNIWLDYNNFKIKKLPLYYIKENIVLTKIKSLMEYFR